MLETVKEDNGLGQISTEYHKFRWGSDTVDSTLLHNGYIAVTVYVIGHHIKSATADLNMFVFEIRDLRVDISLPML